jgi:hypothetical protein
VSLSYLPLPLARRAPAARLKLMRYTKPPGHVGILHRVRHPLLDPELEWLAARLRASGPEREAPTAYALAGKLEDAVGSSVALALSPRELAECQVAIERAMEDGETMSERLLALWETGANEAAEP